MVLERIFGKSLKDVEEEDEEYIDFNKIIEKPKNVEGKMEIKIEKLLEFRDAEKIQREVREGKIDKNDATNFLLNARGYLTIAELNKMRKS